MSITNINLVSNCATNSEVQRLQRPGSLQESTAEARKQQLRDPQRWQVVVSDSLICIHTYIYIYIYIYVHIHLHPAVQMFGIDCGSRMFPGIVYIYIDYFIYLCMYTTWKYS